VPNRRGCLFIGTREYIILSFCQLSSSLTDDIEILPIELNLKYILPGWLFYQLDDHSEAHKLELSYFDLLCLWTGKDF